MKRFLLTCHDAGGTVPPLLALAEALLARGHEVAILSQPSVRERAKAASCGFFAFSEIPDYERGKTIEEQLAIAFPLLTGRAVGDNVLGVAEEVRADLIVVDATLGGALAAGESLPQRSAVLLHRMYKTFVDTWFPELWPLLASAINETREAYGLGPADSWSSLLSGHDRLLSVVPQGFDAPVGQVPDTMRHFGFLVPAGAPGAEGAVGFPTSDDPTVLVGLSTTYQHQERLLASIIDALRELAVRALVTTAYQVDPGTLRPAPNVAVAEFVPHGVVMHETDVMVTHAGLGSVASALDRGVPLVCTPIGRDQHLNAERVVALGAGVALGDEPDADHIAAAVSEVLSTPSYRLAAQSLAQASRNEGRSAAAAADLESMADDT